jgi:hypothetical protein
MKCRVPNMVGSNELNCTRTVRPKYVIWLWHVFWAVLLIFAVDAGVLGQASSQPSPKTGSTTSSPIDLSGIDTPKDLAGLLINIRIAMNRGFLLHDSFYSDEVLKQVWGGQRISWTDTTFAVRVGGEMTGFGAMVAPVIVAGGSVEGLSLSFDRFWKSGNLYVASLVIHAIGETEVDFRTIVNVFGADWERAEPQIRLANPAKKMPTQPFGNEEIVYSALGKRGCPGFC